MEHAGGLAGQVDARLLHQAEGAAVVIQRAAARPQADVGEGDVAGFLQGLRRGLAAVAGMVPAVEDLLAALDLLGAAAVKRIGRRDCAGIECRRQREDLERRARFIAVGDAAVAPLLQAGVAHGGVIGVEGLRAGRGIFGLLFRLGVKLLDLCAQVLVINFLIIVRVIAAERAHGDDLARFAVHDDAERAVEHVIAVHGVLHLLLQIILHRRVERQVDAVAVGRLIIFLIGIEHLRLVVALRRDDGSGRALQLVIIIGLQPLGADVLGVRKADDLRRDIVIGIVALRIRLEMHADDLILRNDLADLVADLLRLAALDDLVAQARISGLLLDPARIQIEHGRELLCQRRDVDLVLRQLQRVEENILHTRRGRQHIAVAVIDRAARGGDARAAGLVADGLCLIIIVVDEHELHEHARHGAKADDTQQDHQAKDALAHMGRRDLLALRRAAASSLRLLLHSIPSRGKTVEKRWAAILTHRPCSVYDMNRAAGPCLKWPSLPKFCGRLRRSS